MNTEPSIERTNESLESQATEGRSLEIEVPRKQPLSIVEIERVLLANGRLGSATTSPPCVCFAVDVARRRDWP